MVSMAFCPDNPGDGLPGLGDSFGWRPIRAGGGGSLVFIFRLAAG